MQFLILEIFLRWPIPPVNEHLGSCHVTNTALFHYLEVSHRAVPGQRKTWLASRSPSIYWMGTPSCFTPLGSNFEADTGFLSLLKKICSLLPMGSTYAMYVSGEEESWGIKLKSWRNRFKFKKRNNVKQHKNHNHNVGHCKDNILNEEPRLVLTAKAVRTWMNFTGKVLLIVMLSGQKKMESD